MTMPPVERPRTDEEIEYQVQMKIRGEAEERQIAENQMQGDFLDYDDGRPGIYYDTWGNIHIPFSWQFIAYFVVLALIAIMAFTTRACVGEERTQEILHGGNAGASSNSEQAP